MKCLWGLYKATDFGAEVEKNIVNIHRPRHYPKITPPDKYQYAHESSKSIKNGGHVERQPLYHIQNVCTVPAFVCTKYPITLLIYQFASFY